VLHREGISPEARRALIFAAERSQCYDGPTRRSLTEVLLSQALVMRDAGERQPLWAAIRRYASMVPVSEASALLQFLRDEDVPATKQAALQAIQHIFAVEVLGDHPVVRELCARVHILAEALTTPTCLSERGGPALALEAFCAAASLGDVGLPSLAPALAGLGRPYLLERAEEHLQSLDEHWGHQSQDARTERARVVLHEARALLVAPKERDEPA
jgi:hypothetical protein